MIVRTVALICDGCGRHSSTRGYADLTLARSAARNEGWTYQKGQKRDLCPRCSPKPGQ